MTGKLYRYIDNYRKGSWFFNEEDNETNIPHLESYPIIRETDKTWFINYYRKIKRVGKEWNKQFACDTIEKAKESYIRRKNMQIEINKNILNIAQLGLIGINKASTKEIDTWPSWID